MSWIAAFEIVGDAVAAVAVAAGDGDHLAGVGDAWAFDLARVDRVAERADHVLVAAEVPDAGEASEQSLLRVRDAFEQIVGAVALGGAEAGAQRVAADAEQVDVHVDQPGEDELVLEVDQRRAGGWGGVAVADLGNPARL